MRMRTLLLGLMIHPFLAHANCTSYDSATGTLTIRAAPVTTSCPTAVIEKSSATTEQARSHAAERPAAVKLREISNRRYHAAYISGQPSRTYYGQKGTQ